MEKLSSVDEFHVAVDIAEFSHLLQSQPRKLYSNSWRRRRIQKVLPHMRQRREQSYGPYHHGKPELRRAEEYKHLCLHHLTGGNEKKQALFYSKIFDEIEVIRDSYAEAEMVMKKDDKSLALMMLLDAIIMINFIGKKGDSFWDWLRCLGAGSGPLMIRDMLVMENQIPFRVVKLLISLQYEKEEDDPPTHFLEAFWRVLVKKHDINSSTDSRVLRSRLSVLEKMEPTRLVQ